MDHTLLDANNNRFYNTSNQKTWSESGYAQLTSADSYNRGHAQDFMPQIGDLILFETIGSWNDGPDHIGVVVDVPDENNVTIIEGNATVSGSGNSRKAGIKKRTISWKNGSDKVYGFCRPDYDR